MEAFSAISKLITILNSDSSFREEVTELTRKQDQIKHDVIRIGVLGVTSAGKSTLINSLLGEELLPAEAKPSSSQLVSCKKGKSREANIYFTDNRKETFRNGALTPEIISRYGNENKNVRNREKVSQIEILSPTLALPANVELVDSPGLDAYGLDGHEQITMETLLPSVDFCIFVTTCKTNSDNKMLSVLNAVSRYGKPVVIVQNMIDSLRGTPDGRKSVTQVAKEHIVRIRRVVDRSEIKDKASVYILQMSARYALKCRQVLLRGGKLNDAGKNWWMKSGFEEFEKLLKDIPTRLSAVINNSRLNSLSIEIDRIIDQIAPSASGIIKVDNTDFNRLYDNIIEKVDRSIGRISEDIRHYVSHVENSKSISSARDVEDVKNAHSEWTSRISSIIRDYNEGIASFCRTLNISMRDIRYSFIPSQSSALRVRQKNVTRERKQSGFWGGVKRFFSFGLCGYETVSEQVDDWEATRQEILKFLKRAMQDYGRQLSAWRKNISDSNSYIQDAIETKKRQRDEALRRNLDADKKRAILSQLKLLKEQIGDRSQRNFKGEEVSLKVNIIRSKMNPMAYCNYSVAKDVIRKIHRRTYSLIFGKSKINVYSWDEPSTLLFLSEFAGLLPDVASRLCKGSDRHQLMSIYRPHEPSTHSSGFVAVIFVNLTQPGAAKKQIMDLLNGQKNIRSEEIVFIIQDLQEVVNGGDFRNAFADMHSFFKSKLGNTDFRWFSIDRNPLHNIALWEIQCKRTRTHNEELQLASDLKKKLGLYYQRESDGIIADFIRVLSN